MLCARHWASVGWLNAWTSASDLMAITLFVAFGHSVWAVVLMGDLEHGPNVGKSGFVSHTKHTAEVTNMDLFHT